MKRARGSCDVEVFQDSDSDGLDLASDVSKPKGSASGPCVQRELPAGPHSFQELFQWQYYVISRLLRQKPELQAKGCNTGCYVHLTSSYSGIGVAEVAAHFVQDAMKQSGLAIQVESHSQTEKNAQCYPLCAAAHVFGDLFDRVPEKVVTKLTKLQDKHIKRLQTGADKQKKKGKGRQHFDPGSDFVVEAMKYLDSMAGDVQSQLLCAVCDHPCEWHPPACSEREIWVETAGNTCTPWSRRGKQEGWLSRESLPCLIWAASLKHCPRGPPDVIVNECVEEFPAEFFFHTVFPGSVVMSCVYSPTDFGIPTNRPRRYSLVFPKPTSLLLRHIEFSGSALTAIAFRRLHLKASVYLQAPPEEVKVFCDELANLRGLPARPEGFTYACKAVMPPGDRIRMESQRESLLQSGVADLDYVVDCSQTNNFAHPMQVMPTLLRNSSLFSLRGDRLFLVEELMAAQGLPRYLPDDMMERLWPYRGTHAFLQWMKEKDIRTSLGNAMHVSQIGVALACVFMAGASVSAATS